MSNVKHGLKMNRTRYEEIKRTIYQRINDEDTANNIIEEICIIFNFDPTQMTYDPEYGRKQMERKRQVAKEQGKSEYEIFVKPYRKGNRNKNVIIENQHPPDRRFRIHM